MKAKSFTYAACRLPSQTCEFFRADRTIMRRTGAEDAKARAEAVFRKPREHEALEAASRQAIDAERAAITARTARLRELRLAKEEADRLAMKAAGLGDSKGPRHGAEPHIKHAVVDGRTLRYTTKIREVAVVLTIDQQPNNLWLARGSYEGQVVEATAQSATAVVKRWQEIAEFRGGEPGHRRFAGFPKPRGKP